MQGQLAVAQLTSPLAYFFISPEIFRPFLSLPIYRTMYHALSDTSSRMHLHTIRTTRIVLYLIPSLASNVLSIGAGFGNRNSDHRDDISLRRGRIGSNLVRW